MNGTDISFDTNTLIGYLSAHPALKQFSGSQVTLSNITGIEFYSYPDISVSDKHLPEAFLSRVRVVDLQLSNLNLTKKIIELRKLHKFKIAGCH